MSISKSAFSLSKDEYEGTGKRLFIGLVIGTAILLCVLLLLIWLVPTIGFAAIHPWLPFIAGIVFGGAILGILWLSVGLVLHAYTGKPILGTSRLRGITIRLLLPIMELMGRMMRIPVAAVRRSFIKVNNELVLSSGIQCEPRQLLVLLPHCIQSSRCTHRLTYHIDNCARCGACPLKAVLLRARSVLRHSGYAPPAGLRRHQRTAQRPLPRHLRQHPAARIRHPAFHRHRVEWRMPPAAGIHSLPPKKCFRYLKAAATLLTFVIIYNMVTTSSIPNFLA